MDLLATVRKEGSRGGQTDFKWDDVQNSSRREHYLGHSLMAPVGRWAKGRDLNWYAKTEKADHDEEDGEDTVEKAARERKEEIQRVKHAEEDAIARALGLPVTQRNNANMEPVSDKREVDKNIKNLAGVDDERRQGIGYGASTKLSDPNVVEERIKGNAEDQGKELQYALKEYRRRHHRDNHRDDHRKHRSSSQGQDRDRSRSRSRNRERRRHRSNRDDHPRRRRDRSRENIPDRSRDQHPRRRSRSGSPARRHERHERRHRDRSRDVHRSQSFYQSRQDDSRRHDR